MKVKTCLSYSIQSFKFDSLTLFKKKLLYWANQFETCCYLDNNRHRYNYPGYEGLVAVGHEALLTHRVGQGPQRGIRRLGNFFKDQKSWLFGFLGYDLKNELESLQSGNPDFVDLPDLYFFQPKYVFELSQKQVRIHSSQEDPSYLFNYIQQVQVPDREKSTFQKSISLKQRIPRKGYLEKVKAIRNHIIEGDLYELNLCQEFFAEEAFIDPFYTFDKLNQLNAAPFSAFLKIKDKYLLCTSPERFLKKTGRKIISQPIKGTIGRGSTPELDEKNRKKLFESAKDRAENVMIVDLVRNDLARSCMPGTVEVEELFGIYTFEQVHQMISTVVGALLPDISLAKIIENAFPMGSMTGAPKVICMELIDHYEESKRGLYSGAVGYITPYGDFDFNVVIRSILYNASNHYLSVHTGGAIIYDSDPMAEYEECLIKIGSIKRLLESRG